NIRWGRIPTRHSQQEVNLTTMYGEWKRDVRRNPRSHISGLHDRRLCPVPEWNLLRYHSQRLGPELRQLKRLPLQDTCRNRPGIEVGWYSPTESAFNHATV